MPKQNLWDDKFSYRLLRDPRMWKFNETLNSRVMVVCRKCGSCNLRQDIQGNSFYCLDCRNSMAWDGKKFAAFQERMAPIEIDKIFRPDEKLIDP